MTTAVPSGQVRPDMGLGLSLGERTSSFPDGYPTIASSSSSSSLRKSSRHRSSSNAGRHSALDGPIAATTTTTTTQAALTPKQSDVVERTTRSYEHTRSDSAGRASALPRVPETSSTAFKRTSRPSVGGRSTPGLRSHTPGPLSLPPSSSLSDSISSAFSASTSSLAPAASMNSRSSAPRRSHLRNGSSDIDMDSGLDTALSIVNSPIIVQSSDQATPQAQQQQFQPIAPTLTASELRIPNSASSRELAMHAKDFVKAISTLSNVEEGSQTAGSAKANQDELLRKARALLEIEVRAAQYPAPPQVEDSLSWQDSLAKSRALSASSGRRKSNDEWWRGPRNGRRPSATTAEIRPESPLDAHFFGGLSTSASTPEGALGRIALPQVPETSGSRSSGESASGHARKVSGEEDEQEEIIDEDGGASKDSAVSADTDATRPGEEQHRLALKAGLAWALQQQEAMTKQLEKTATENRALRERAEEAERVAKKSLERSPPSLTKAIDVSLPLSPVPASPTTSSPVPGSPASPTTAQRPQPVRLRSKSLFKALRANKVPEPQNVYARREASANSAPFELSGPSNRLSALSTASDGQPSADGHAEISAALNKFAAKNSQSAVGSKISKTFGAFLSGAWNDSTTLTSESQSSLPSVEETEPAALKASLASARQALAKAESEKERLQTEVEEVSTQLFSEANELVKQERIKTSALAKEVEQLRATITKRDAKARGKGEGGAAILEGAADEAEQSMMEAVKEAMFACAKAEEESAAMREEVRSMERKVEILEEALFHAVAAVARERSGKQSASADLSGAGLSAVAMGIYDEGKGVTPSTSKDSKLGDRTVTGADETLRKEGARTEENGDDDEGGEAVFRGESVVSPCETPDSAAMSRSGNGSSLSLTRGEQSDSALSFYSVDDAGALSQKGDIEASDDEDDDSGDDEVSEYDDEDAKSAGLQVKEDDELLSDTALTPGPRLSDPAPAVPAPQTAAAIARSLQRASSSSSGGSRGGSPVVRGSPTRREVRASWASSSPSLSGRARPSSIPDQLPVPRSPLPDIPSPNPLVSNSSPEPTSPAFEPPAMTQPRRSLPEKPKLPQRRGPNMAPTASMSSLGSVNEAVRSESELSNYEEAKIAPAPTRQRNADMEVSHEPPAPVRSASFRSQSSLQPSRHVANGGRPYSGLPTLSTAGTLDFNAFESDQAMFSNVQTPPLAQGPASSAFSHGGSSDAGEMRLHRTSTRGSERSHEFLDAASGEWSHHSGSVEGGAPRAPSRQASIRSVASEAPSLARQAGVYGTRKKILSGTKVIGGQGLEQLNPDMGAVLRPPPGAIDEADDDALDEGANSSLKSSKSRKSKKRAVRHPTTFLASSSASTSSMGHGNGSFMSEATVASRSSLVSRSTSMKSQMASRSSLVSSPPMQQGSPSLGSASSIASPRHSMGNGSMKRSTLHSESVYEEARSGAYIRRFAPTAQEHSASAASSPAGRRRNYSQKPPPGAHPPLPSQSPVC